MRSDLWTIVVLGFTSIFPGQIRAQKVDLLIRNGKIIDGTGNPWFKGDIAIHDDRIVKLARHIDAKAKRTIDAKGLIVAPGFIDIHSHSDTLLLEDGKALSKIHQGVTTEILGEGKSAGPRKGKLDPGRIRVDGQTLRWSTLSEYFDILEKQGISVNVASYVGMDNIWQCVMGQSHDRPTPEQIAEMKKLLDEAMQDGALGMSTMLMMPPGSLTKTEDLIDFCKVIAKHQGIYSSHIRNEGTEVFSAIKEALVIGEKANVPVDVIHLKIAEQKLWGRMNEIVKLFEGARAKGVNAQANVYPYTRGNNNLVSIIPPWAHEGGRAKLLERLRDPKLRPRLKKDIREGIDGWYNHYTAVGGDWSRMLVSGKGTYEGLTMDRVMANRTKDKGPNADKLDELFDILIQEGGSVPTVYAHHEEKDMQLALSQPWCSIGSDGSAYAIDGPLKRGNPHPRNFGTFPRALGRYARELNVLRLEDAIRKMTSLNAAKVGLRKRGTLKVGNFADVTIFDPKTVIDKATYTDPFHYNVGIHTVIVNGKIVLDEGKHTGVKPGRALRRNQQ